MSDRKDGKAGDRRYIEAGFPLREASLDSVHEKNVRHGHLSTLHIWPARRPLAACRAALLGALLPDPGTEAGRSELRKRIGGRVKEEPGPDGRLKEKTVGGILHWGRESGPEAAAKLEAFREEIRAAFGGRAPRVLDPFAGGGAIPLEAMRLGCEVTASDLNPVAWFVLRCALHYPQLLAGEKQPLPEFVLRDREFLTAFLKAGGLRERRLDAELAKLDANAQANEDDPGQPDLLAPSPASLEAEFAWHFRALGRRVLGRARQRLAVRYPTYAEFEPVRRKGRGRRATAPERAFEAREPRLLPPDEEGRVSAAALNDAEFDEHYLEDEANPRWMAKPTVAYLWARTAECGNCRAELPLLKTRWLVKKSGKRALLTITPREDGSGRKIGVAFGIEAGVPEGAGSPAQRREHDKQLGAGTKSQSGAKCPLCGAIATMGDLRAQGRAGRIGARMTAVVVDGQQGKEYRLPTAVEAAAARVDAEELEALYRKVPFGMPEEPTPKAGSGASRAFSVDGYGFDRWRKLFTDRQLLALGTLVREIRSLDGEFDEELAACPPPWREALTACLALTLSKFSDYSSALCSWLNTMEALGHTFARFALPIVWDYCEVNPLAATSGSFAAMAEWAARYVENACEALRDTPPPQVRTASALESPPGRFDVICTDPPYYDAIPYSDLMDFFHIWLRRVLSGLSPETDAAFATPLGPKWNAEANDGQGDGELIDDAVRFGGDRAASKRNYEDGMARAFARCREALEDDGRLVIVFANKDPNAWETLVSALIRSGFRVNASWPIQTERQARLRAHASAALSASIWLVCRKRTEARPGWDSQVLAEMERNLTKHLRDFWDAGIRGPDFVWAATGPALEAFSRYPAVRCERAPDEMLTASGFLGRVRRMVVGFVVGRVLQREGEGEERGALDDLTTYYLLHRNDFGLAPAPAGAVVLYALSCGLADSDLSRRWGLLARGSTRGRGSGRGSAAGGEGEGDEEFSASSSGSEARLEPWNRRKVRSLGEPSADGGAPPLIDCLHRLMRLWKAGERSRVDAYLEARGLWNDRLFARLTQAVLELAEGGSEERSLLETIQNYLGERSGAAAPRYAGSIR